MTPLFRWTLIALAILAILTTWPRVLSDNDASRLATVQALVEKRSFSIDDLVLAATQDKVFVRGHFYSDKLPVPAMLGAIVYLPLYLAGLRIDLGGNPAVYLITLILIKGLWLAGLVAFYDALRFTRLSDKLRVALTLGLGIASLYFSWSSTFNNHTLGASFLMMGLDMLLRAANLGSAKKHAFWAGLAFALASCCDAPSAAFYAGGIVYVATNHQLRRSLAYYLMPLLLTVAPTLAINYAISGSLIPLNVAPANFAYPGSKWVGAKALELSGTGVNRGAFLVQYVFNCLFGPRGFILYNPLLILALPMLVRELRPRRPFRREAVLVGLSSLVIVLYYMLYTNNYGGWSYSIRFFIPLLPVLFFFIHPFLEEPSWPRVAAFGVLSAVSVCIAVIGLINPWSLMYLNPAPLIANLMQLRQDPGLILTPLKQLVGAVR